MYYGERKKRSISTGNDRWAESDDDIVCNFELIFFFNDDRTKAGHLSILYFYIIQRVEYRLSLWFSAKLSFSAQIMKNGARYELTKN